MSGGIFEDQDDAPGILWMACATRPPWSHRLSEC